MSTRQRDPKGDVRTHGNLPRKADQSSNVDVNDATGVNWTERVANSQLSRVVVQFTNWDHGYLKMRRASLGGELHLTWTWTLGPATGCYVYTRVQYWQVCYGLELLAQKIFQVDEGILTPTIDKRGGRQV